MGFINTATTITIRARLTNYGREKLLTSTNNIFSHFILECKWSSLSEIYKSRERIKKRVIKDTDLWLGACFNESDCD